MKKKIGLRELRNAAQILFALFLLYLGWRFWLFVSYFETGGSVPLVPRPPAVEGFLPISALMAFRVWVSTGIFDPVHPAGLAIFITIGATAFLFKKAFCSWLCPIGALSEGLSRVGEKLIGEQLRVPRWLDLCLMSIKYLILGFFVKVIFLDMPVLAVSAFLDGPYNKIADVKMLYFFLNLSPLAVKILLVLTLFSILIKHFWCRYLCPYGALLGIISVISPLKITRRDSSCSGCRLCDRVCSGKLLVSKSCRISSAECTGCLNCLDHCPRPGALAIEGISGFSLKPEFFPLLFGATFFLMLGLARVLGYWETSLTLTDFMYLVPGASFFSH